MRYKTVSLIVIFLLYSSLLFARTEVYFSPSKRTQDAIIEYIEKANESLDIAIYSITSKPIAEAIQRARQRGIKVRILVDRIQATSQASLWHWLGAKIDQRSGLMHNKFIIRDNKDVSTGSLNFTNNAIYRNRENLVILYDKNVAKKFEIEFEKLWKDN